MPDFIWIQNVIFPLVGMSMGMATIFMIYRTVNRILDRKLRSGDSAELDELRGELSEMRLEIGNQLADLHERMDFAERALTSGPRRDPAD